MSVPRRTVYENVIEEDENKAGKPSSSMTEKQKRRIRGFSFIKIFQEHTILLSWIGSITDKIRTSQVRLIKVKLASASMHPLWAFFDFSSHGIRFKDCNSIWVFLINLCWEGVTSAEWGLAYLGFRCRICAVTVLGRRALVRQRIFIEVMLARSFPRASLEAGSLLPGYPLENDVERVFENVSVRFLGSK